MYLPELVCNEVRLLQYYIFFLSNHNKVVLNEPISTHNEAELHAAVINDCKKKNLRP